MVLGQSVTLACQVSAQPAAQATWDKGKELSRCQGGGGSVAGQQGVFLDFMAINLQRETAPR